MLAEFYGVINAMKEVQKMGLINVWLECDSVLVCVAFTTKTNLWMLNGILVCLNYGEKIMFIVTHIFF